MVCPFAANSRHAAAQQDVSHVTREIEIQGGRICKCFDYGIHRGVTVRLDKADFEKVRATRGIAKWWPVIKAAGIKPE